MNAPHAPGRVLHSQHGPAEDIRASYTHLPCQPFWTWLTGKGLPLTDAELKAAQADHSEGFLLAHLAFTWAVIGGLVVLGHYILAGSFGVAGGALLLGLGWLLMVNRLRSMQATFHYLTHGAVLKDRQRARRYARWLLTTPLLYPDWDTYNRTHVREHHNIHVLCTDVDPDQVFIQRQGFYPGMPERAYWWRVCITPFSPRYLLRQWHDALLDTFVRPAPHERQAAWVFWAAALSLLWAVDGLGAFALMYLVARAVWFEHAMWLQLFTEHLWFYPRQSGRDDKTHYGRLTWGRFQGRRPPRQGLWAKCLWAVQCLVCDVPVRLYVYPQDLPNHDCHHRRPNVHYRHIANYRATVERAPSAYGPFIEVWGFTAGLRVIRDHLCRGVHEPFAAHPSASAVSATTAPCSRVDIQGA
ncbi:hypothetical protein [Pseudomonas japonica]|uniref:hypothetical protein n=1 Tax=Pseudomonas japonica TaxID=256466 RepID=UPI0015E44C54|nr:hypothetical protein [Pseudomonas japonica]MBA1243850.1 hypothetical protein [Pseudomonas japonica]MBA1288436.1 hypothetical protein [Pseudomonas japonica]